MQAKPSPPGKTTSITVYIATLGEITEEIFGEFTHQMKSADILTANQFRQKDDRFRMVAGRMLLSYGLKDLNADLRLSDVKVTEYGRLYFEHPIDFNISHSGEFIVCAISANTTLGIDIEHCKEIDTNDFRSCFALSEWATIEANPELRVFYEFWTKKEAALKAHGKGLSTPAVDAEVVGNQVKLHDKIWHIQSLAVHPDYVCHVASQDYASPISIQLVNLRDCI